MESGSRDPEAANKAVSAGGVLNVEEDSARSAAEQRIQRIREDIARTHAAQKDGAGSD